MELLEYINKYHSAAVAAIVLTFVVAWVETFFPPISKE